MKDGDQGASFWRGYGKKHFPIVVYVARALLGAPASSAVLERDFGEAGKLVNRQRSSLSPAYVEMLMYLRGALDAVPEDVPSLTEEAAKAAIPTRLVDPRKRAMVADINATSDEDVPVDNADAAFLWSSFLAAVNNKNFQNVFPVSYLWRTV
ncbi:unnamed protein product [Scytosiphon promiscuus]